jgi:outer membrane receptor protein involved in Fe transport
LLASQGLVDRTRAKSDTDRRYDNIDFNASYDYRGARLKNFSQLGAYTRITSTRGTTLLGSAPPAHSRMNIYTGQILDPFRPDYPLIQKGAFTATTNWNAYWQNRTALWSDRVVVTLGLNYGQNHPGGAPVQKGTIMPNLAVNYNFSPAITAYYSYATSFNPVDPSLENARGQRGVFDPVKGANHELGARWDLPDRRLSLHVALFRSYIQNSLVQTGANELNVNGNRFFVPAGTRRSKGAELSADYRLRNHWLVSGSVTYLSSIYTGQGPISAAATLPIPGSPAEKTPRWAYTARTTYERSEGRLAGFNAGLLLTWQGQRLGSNGARTPAAPDPLMLPAYTRVDAHVGYSLKQHWDWSLNVDNLTDQLIFINATTGAAMEIAPPRNVVVRVGYRF